MKRIIPFFALIVIIVLASFISGKDPVATEVKTGRYGMCGVDSANATIELYLRKDSTFRYYNVSYPQGTADLDGKWRIEKGAVVLYDYKSEFPIHNKWKIEEGNSLKSMKPVGAGGGVGMLMFRIFHLESCETK